jgi:hypothetical protein
VFLVSIVQPGSCTVKRTDLPEFRTFHCLFMSLLFDESPMDSQKAARKQMFSLTGCLDSGEPGRGTASTSPRSTVSVNLEAH